MVGPPIGIASSVTIAYTYSFGSQPALSLMPRSPTLVQPTNDFLIPAKQASAASGGGGGSAIGNSVGVADGVGAGTAFGSNCTMRSITNRFWHSVRASGRQSAA